MLHWLYDLYGGHSRWRILARVEGVSFASCRTRVKPWRAGWQVIQGANVPIPAALGAFLACIDSDFGSPADLIVAVLPA